MKLTRSTVDDHGLLCPRSQGEGENEHTGQRPGRGALLAKVRPTPSVQTKDHYLGAVANRFKVRRVKCDEARPACLRCTSTDRACDGYCIVEPLSSSHSDVVSVSAGPSFDIHVHTTPESRRSFAFFMQRTCPQQAGFFGSDFWERLVFQAAYHESAVRHAIVAIGSLHELSENQTALKDVDKSFALEQYNLAIRDLLLPLSKSGKRGVDVCLISCLLFTCFEVRMNPFNM
jgi:hypothetical protein